MSGPLGSGSSGGGGGGGGGLYKYQLTSANVTEEGEYICIFKTASTTPDQQHIPAIWCIQKAGVETLNNLRVARRGY